MTDEQEDYFSSDYEDVEPPPQVVEKPKPKSKTSQAKLDQLKKAREAKQRKRLERNAQQSAPIPIPPKQPKLRADQGRPRARHDRSEPHK